MNRHDNDNDNDNDNNNTSNCHRISSSLHNNADADDDSTSYLYSKINCIEAIKSMSILKKQTIFQNVCMYVCMYVSIDCVRVCINKRSDLYNVLYIHKRSNLNPHNFFASCCSCSLLSSQVFTCNYSDLTRAWHGMAWRINHI
jgi:hypothetical protein